MNPPGFTPTRVRCGVSVRREMKGTVITAIVAIALAAVAAAGVTRVIANSLDQQDPAGQNAPITDETPTTP
jgi:hypothetical protein